MKKILIRSLIISSVLSAIISAIDIFMQEVPFNSEVVDLQISLTIFRTLIFFFPIFIGCIWYGIWEKRTEKKAQHNKTLSSKH